MSTVSPGASGLHTLSSAVMAQAYLILSFAAVVAAVTLTAANITPKFNTTTEHLTVVEGGRATLPCTVESMGDQSVIWINPKKTVVSMGDRRLIDDHRISVERPYTKIWNLLIRNVRHNDTGTYECRINTNPVQTKKVYMDVKVPPAIVSHLSSDRVVLEEGQTATLVCNVTGIPQPNVTWYKHNERGSQHKSKEKIGSEGEVLIIHNVTRSCDDLYECHVDNGVPPAVSKAIEVVVNYPPEVVVPNPRRMGQYVGKETILDCHIYANPHALNAWYKDGRKIEKTENFEVDVFKHDQDTFVTLALRIRNITPADFGRYECTGSNFLGEDKEEMILYELATTTLPTTHRSSSLPELLSVNKPTDRQIYDAPKSAKPNVNPLDDHRHRIGGPVDDTIYPQSPLKEASPARSKSTASIGSDGPWNRSTQLHHNILFYLPFMCYVLFHIH